MPITLKDAQGNDVEIPTTEELNKTITGAVLSQIDKANKKLGETLLTQVAESVKQTLEEYEAARGATEEDPDDADPPEGDPKPGVQALPTDIEKHPVVRGLKKQLDALTKSAEEAKQRVVAERAKSRENKLRSTVTEQLTQLGVSPKAIKQALAYLVDGEKRVHYADDEGDELIYRDDTGDLDISSGLKTWSTSDEAQIYMPARGTAGSGSRPAQPGSKTTTVQRGDLGRALIGVVNNMDAGVGV